MRDALIGGVTPDAFIAIEGHVLDGFNASLLVDGLHRDRDRNDLVAGMAGCGRCRGTQLALNAIVILGLTPDVVALGDHFGGLQHRPVDLGLVDLEPAVDHVLGVHVVLDHRDRLDAAGDIHIAFTCHDPLRTERNRLKSRRAEAIDGHARHAHRHAGTQGDLAGDIRAGRAFRIGAAHDHILDFGGVDLGALKCGRHDMAAHGRAMGHVERAAP